MALIAAGCASPSAPIQPAHTADFLRGCWVSKTEPGGPALGFLRLLPDGPDGENLRGEYRKADGWKLLSVFSFRRDGSQASWRYGFETQTLHLKRSGEIVKSREWRPIACLTWEAPGGHTLQARVEDERLVIVSGSRSGSQGVFSGVRDGCD